MIGKSTRLVGATRATDMTVARCNFRRLPLPVSGMSAPFVLSQRQWFKIAVLLFVVGLAGGIILGVLGYAFLNLRGILP